MIKKSLILIFVCFLIVGVLSSGIVLADDDNSNDNSENSNSDDSNKNGDSNSNSDDEDKEEKSDDEDDDSENDENEKEDDDKEEDEKNEIKTKQTIIDEQGRKIEIETKTETKNGETETKETRKYIDENGDEIKITTKTEIEDGETEIEIKKKIKYADGTEVTIKTKTEIENGEEETSYSIKIKGAEVNTKLSVKSKFEDNQTKLKVKLSTGVEQDIITSPDQALQTALDELKATNNFTFKIKELGEGDKIKAVFSAKAKKSGNLLGLFNVQVDLETLIDTQTGEVIQTNRPWWAFLVVGADQATMCHIPTDAPNTRQTITIQIPEVKTHLAHGDSLDKCVAVCGDNILVEGTEACEIGNTQECTTTEAYAGIETCNTTCDSYDACITTESCGDGIVNGNEECDDGNILADDGCDNLCQIEVVPPEANETASTNNTII